MGNDQRFPDPYNPRSSLCAGALIDPHANQEAMNGSDHYDSKGNVIDLVEQLHFGRAGLGEAEHEGGQKLCWAFEPLY
jgi:hypothetical protein